MGKANVSSSWNPASFLPLLQFVYILLRRYANTVWITLNIKLGQKNSTVTTATRHKVAIIGDTMALGLGDWVTLAEVGGVAPHLLRVSAATTIVQIMFVQYQPVTVPCTMTTRTVCASDVCTPSKHKIIFHQTAERLVCERPPVHLKKKGKACKPNKAAGPILAF